MTIKNTTTSIFSVIISLVIFFRSIMLLITFSESYWYKDLSIFWIIFGISNFLFYIYTFRISIWLLNYKEKGRRSIIICSSVLLFFWLFIVTSLVTGFYPKEIWFRPLDMLVPLFYVLVIFYYSRQFVKKQFE